MKNILLIGAGKSAYTLIKYLTDESGFEKWNVVIADKFPENIKKLFPQSPFKILELSLENESLRHELIQNSDLVISMLPASMHPIVAKDCLKFAKHLITPSYISEEMKALHQEAKNKGLIFINELGLDPGIDHMSAMQIIHHLKEEKYNIEAFESFTGGLVAPESDDNPWHYKFTWNPRNVILAGQGGAVKFLHNAKYKYIPYHKLFDRTEIINIDNYGTFEGLANRDSLKYIDIYGLEGVKTIYRGTLRRPPFSKAWHILVQIGATDDSYVMENVENMTYRDFMNSFLKYREGDSVELKLAYYLKIDVDSEPMKLLKWAGLFKKEKIGLKNASPAKILQHRFEQLWSMKTTDIDMIVMWHLFIYEKNGVYTKLESSMVVKGDNHLNTAMAKTVGLPIGIAAKLVLNNEINVRGVLMPTEKEIYTPVLKELDKLGISFSEKITPNFQPESGK
jgi:saccharopine dehydrogenase-like NADP-dependent oxidoreductase